MTRRWLYLVIILLCIWNIFLTVVIFDRRNMANQNENTTTIIQNEVHGFSTDLTQIVDLVQSSIVTIETENSSASGIIIEQVDNIVYIVTSYHVIENSENINVALDNYERISASLVGYDAVRDVAVLSINSNVNVTPISFGDSSLLNKGEYVLAIGSPLSIDYRGSLSFGIVSSNERCLDLEIGDSSYYIYMIQSDITLNSGNSGGPLVNMAGELVGINTLVVSVDDAEGLSFSLTSNELRHIADEIIRNSEVTRMDLGIKVSAIRDMANYQKANLGIELDQVSGLYVDDVKDGFIGSNIGLLRGDIIININGIMVNDVDDMIAQEYLSEGFISVDILRADNIITLESNFSNIEEPHD